MPLNINFLGGLVPNYSQEILERTKYKLFVDDPRMIDIWYENHGFGFVNSKYETVVLAESPRIIKNFDGFADSVGAINFVADAFIAFREDYINKVNNSTIGYPPYLSDLVPVKGYQSFEELYGNWSTYSAAKYSADLQDNQNIVDYHSYLEEIKKLLMQYLDRFPITKSGFCISKHNEISTSGLSIELAELDYDIDLQKGEIIQSPDFQCFADLANAYGFNIDKHVPWRLLCNLEHPTTRIFIRSLDMNGLGLQGDERHRHLTTEQIFDNIYRTKTHFDDLFVLQDFIVKVYNRIVREAPLVKKPSQNFNTGKIETKSIPRKAMQTLSQSEWIDLLVMVRLLEIGMYTRQDHEEITSELISIVECGAFTLRHVLAKLGQKMSDMLKIRLSTGGYEN